MPHRTTLSIILTNVEEEKYENKHFKLVFVIQKIKSKLIVFQVFVIRETF